MLIHTSPPHFRYMYRQVRLSGESLTNYVAILWVAFGQPCSYTAR